METINSWYHSLASDYTCHSEEFTEEEVLEQLSTTSLQGLCPCTLPSSQIQPGRGFVLGFPNLPTSFQVRPPLAGNHHTDAFVGQWCPKNTHAAHSQPGKSPPCPARELRLGCRFCFPFSQSPFEVHRLVLLRAGYLSVLHSHHCFSFLVC